MKDWAESILNPPNETVRAYPTPEEREEAKERKDWASGFINPGQKRGELEVPVTPDPLPFSAFHKAAWVDNPKDKLRILAEARFPDDPQAIERYAIKDGEVLYLGEDNKVYKEDLEGIGSFKKYAAEVAGKSLPLAGGIGGAVAGGMSGGPILAAPAAVHGAMGGEAARKLIANLVLDEEQTSKGNAAAILGEGALAGTGELTGNLIAKFLNRGVEPSLSRWQARGGELEKSELERKAADIGVDLFLPQSTDLPSAKAKMELLGTMRQTADQVDAALEDQSRRANSAAENFFAGLADDRQPVQGVPAGAREALSIAEKRRQQAAKPFYDAAFDRKVVTTPEMAELAKHPGFQKVMEYAKMRAANEGVDLGKEDNVMMGLHWVQYSLRHLDEAMQRNPEIGLRMGLDRKLVNEWRTQVLDFLQEKSDQYALARYMYAGGSEEIERITGGVVGDIAKATDENIEQLATRIFNPARNSPTAIRNARNIFYRYGQADKWNRLVQYYLRDTFQQEFRRAAGPRGAASRWARNVFKNPAKREVLKNALTADQYQKLENMADVFMAIERSGASGFPGSRTQPLQQAREEIMREAEGPAVTWARNPWKATWDFIAEVRMGQHAEQLAEIITTPGANVNKLKELRKLSPRDERFIRLFADVFALAPKGTSIEEVKTLEEPQQGISLEELMGGVTP